MQSNYFNKGLFRFKSRTIILIIFSIAITLRLIYFNQNENNPLMYMPVLDEEYYINIIDYPAITIFFYPKKRLRALISKAKRHL